MALSERTWETQQLRRRARRAKRDGNEVVPFAAEFVPVTRAADGEGIYEGGTWVAPVDGAIRTGGLLNTLTWQWERAAAAPDRARYYFGEAQRLPLEFGGAKGPVRRFVCVGSMGSGKTEILARWVLKMSQKFRNAMIGIFAPTGKRRMIIYKKVRKLLPKGWIAPDGINTTEGEVLLINGVVLKFVALKEYSKDIGSPAAGLDLVAAAIDEEQDCSQESLDEVEMRGRAAPGGFYPVMSSCTLKDTPEWRARKSLYDNRNDVVVYRMLLADNPFVPLSYIEGLKHSLSKRAFRMRVLALDARPELATYPDFQRDLHVRIVPRIGVRDITAAVCGKPMLIGHDPGKLWHVSLGLKAYQLPGIELPVWWVVWERSTRESLLAKHIAEVHSELRERNLGPGDCAVVADPYSDSSEAKPGLSVYRQWRNAGYKIRPAAYSVVRPNKPGRVKKDDGIEVVNSLLLNADDVTRLYIDCDDRQVPVAEKLVAALETQARDDKGEAEMNRKDIHDTTHWPASLRYGLFPWERVRLTAAMNTKGQRS